MKLYFYCSIKKMKDLTSKLTVYCCFTSSELCYLRVQLCFFTTNLAMQEHLTGRLYYFCAIVKSTLSLAPFNLEKYKILGQCRNILGNKLIKHTTHVKKFQKLPDNCIMTSAICVHHSIEWVKNYFTQSVRDVCWSIMELTWFCSFRGIFRSWPSTFHSWCCTQLKVCGV